jgi:uncharacterized damage-inducible protein DinB
MEKIDRSALLVMHQYNDYANALVLDTAEKMTAEELTRECSPSHGSVKKLLLHIALCEYGFMLRCTGIPLDSITEDFEVLDLAGIRALFARVAKMRQDYLDIVNENELNEIITIQMKQKPLDLARWQMLAQSLIHSTHHRGELSIVMTGLGYPLPTLDVILQFIRESGQDWPFD